MNNEPNNQNSNNQPPTRPHKPKTSPSIGGVSRGAAIRAQRRSQEDAQKIANQYAAASPEATPQRRANLIVDNFDKLKITFLGGQEAIGEKNMQVVEWQNDALILDCGNHLGIELPALTTL